jgi:hypothetical protein
MMEQRLKKHEENMEAEIERRVDPINEMAHSAAPPQVQVDPFISPTARKSSCASTEVPEEQRAIEGAQVDDCWRFLTSLLTMPS